MKLQMPTQTHQVQHALLGMLVLAVGILPLAILPASTAWIWAVPCLHMVWYLVVQPDAGMPRWSQARRLVTISVVFLVLLQVMRPQGAAAQVLGCASEPRPCLDQAKLDMYLGLMQFFWQIDRIFLYLARQIEALRDWLINEVLTVAFEATLAGLKVPLWYAAALAWIVFTASYMAQAIIDLRWVDLRRAIRNGLFILLLFNVGSSALTATEQVRLQVGQGFADLAQTSIDCVQANECGSGSEPAVTFLASKGTAADAMAAPFSIYDGDHDCNPSTKRDVSARFLNDYTANYLWAWASDIHCPSDTQGASNLPVVFRSGTDDYGSYGGTEFSGFIEKERIDDVDDQGERTRLINLAGAGLFRLIVGLFLSFGSVVEQLIHLVLALSLAAVWFGLLLALLFAFFLPTESLYRAQIDAMLNVFKTSWMTSFWLGIGLALLNMAAASGSGLAVAGVGAINLCLTGWQSKVAIGLFQSSMESATTAMGGAPTALKGAGSGFFGGIGGVIGAAGASAVGMGGAYALWKSARGAGNDRATSAAWAYEGWKNRRQGLGGLASTKLQLDRVERQQHLRDQNANMIETQAQMEEHLGAIREGLSPRSADSRPPTDPDQDWDQTVSYRPRPPQPSGDSRAARAEAPTVRLNPYGGAGGVDVSMPAIPVRDGYPRGATAPPIGDDPAIQEILSLLRAEEHDDQRERGEQPDVPVVVIGPAHRLIAQPDDQGDATDHPPASASGERGKPAANNTSPSTDKADGVDLEFDPVKGTWRSPSGASAAPVQARQPNEPGATPAPGAEAVPAQDQHGREREAPASAAPAVPVVARIGAAHPTTASASAPSPESGTVGPVEAGPQQPVTISAPGTSSGHVRGQPTGPTAPATAARPSTASKATINSVGSGLQPSVAVPIPPLVSGEAGGTPVPTGTSVPVNTPGMGLPASRTPVITPAPVGLPGHVAQPAPVAPVTSSEPETGTHEVPSAAAAPVSAAFAPDAAPVAPTQPAVPAQPSQGRGQPSQGRGQPPVPTVASVAQPLPTASTSGANPSGATGEQPLERVTRQRPRRSHQGRLVQQQSTPASTPDEPRGTS